jgi:multicomponent Na+:H+ antiporter subunit D
VKSSLFLVEGMIEHATGTSRLDRLSGLSHRSGMLAALFLLPALSLAGIPPFSGFVAKLGLITAGIDAGDGVLVGVAIACSLLTLVSMMKIWVGAFWGPEQASWAGAPGDGGNGDVGALPVRWPVSMVGATVVMVAVGLALAVAAGPVYGLCERASLDIADPQRYVDTVLGR